MQLTGKVAIVTGASRGVGKGIARAYAREGAAVVVAARTETARGRIPGTIHETVEEIRALGGVAIPVRCDVSREEDVQSLVDTTIREFGAIDILVNNAGGAFAYKRIIDFPVPRFDQAWSVNVRGPFLLCRAALPFMIPRKAGVILNITSGAATKLSRPGDTVYGLTKAALDRFSIGLAREVRKHNIAVLSVSPGSVRTEGMDLMSSDLEIDWTGWQHPDDIGPAFVWLAQQTAETFTGRVVRSTDYGKEWP